MNNFDDVSKLDIAIGRFWGYYWELTCWLKRIFICFWKGHDQITGYQEMYEADYCDRCYIDYPEDVNTFPLMWENFIYKLPEWLYNRLAK